MKECSDIISFTVSSCNIQCIQEIPGEVQRYASFWRVKQKKISFCPLSFFSKAALQLYFNHRKGQDISFPL